MRWLSPVRMCEMAVMVDTLRWSVSMMHTTRRWYWWTPTCLRFTEPLPVHCFSYLKRFAALTRRIFVHVARCYSHAICHKMGCMKTPVGMTWRMHSCITHFVPSSPPRVRVLRWRQRRWWWILPCHRCLVVSHSTPDRMNAKNTNGTITFSLRRISCTRYHTLTCMSGKPSRLGFRMWRRWPIVHLRRLTYHSLR